MSDMKVLRQARKLAAPQGWTVEVVPSGHLRFTSPEGRSVQTAQTPSDRRTWLNARTRLRRAGLSVPRDFKLGQ